MALQSLTYGDDPTVHGGSDDEDLEPIKGPEALRAEQAKHTRGSDDGLLSIFFKCKKASKVSPRVDEGFKQRHARLIKDMNRDLTFVLSDSVVCDVPFALAKGLSDKSKNLINGETHSTTSISLQSHEHIVVEMVAEYIFKNEYPIDNGQTSRSYESCYLRHTNRNEKILLSYDGNETELHLKVYLCAKELGLDMLEVIAARNVRNSLVNEKPDVHQFLDILERHDLFNASKGFDESILRSFATYGALHRMVWLVQARERYSDFLSKSRYAGYEALAQCDTHMFMNRNHISMQVLSIPDGLMYTQSAQAPFSNKRPTSNESMVEAPSNKARATTPKTAHGSPTFTPVVKSEPTRKKSFFPRIQTPVQAASASDSSESGHARLFAVPRTLQIGSLPPTPTASEFNRSFAPPVSPPSSFHTSQTIEDIVRGSSTGDRSVGQEQTHDQQDASDDEDGDRTFTPHASSYSPPPPGQPAVPPTQSNSDKKEDESMLDVSALAVQTTDDSGSPDVMRE